MVADIEFQFSSVTQSCLTLWPHGVQHTGFPVHYQLLELALTHVHWIDDAIQPFHPLSPLLLTPSIFPSIKVFSNESALHIRWPNYCSFSFSISSSKKYSGLLSFRIDWFDLLAVQGTLKSSPAPQFQTTNSLALSLLYGPTLTSIHDSRNGPTLTSVYDYWKYQGFDYMDLCQQSDVSAL